MLLRARLPTRPPDRQTGLATVHTTGHTAIHTAIHTTLSGAMPTPHGPAKPHRQAALTPVKVNRGPTLQEFARWRSRVTS